MHLDGYIILGSAIIGLLVGMTGSGGGALMTPMLVLMFGVTPSSAISSDLVAALFMRPVGGAVHMRRKTVNFRLVAWLAAGSVPAAFCGTIILNAIGTKSGAEKNVELALGAALLLGSSGMLLRILQRRRRTGTAAASTSHQVVRPLPTLAIGLVGGLVVGMTSVGAGSLMIVLLLLLYPTIDMQELVGTDLVQAVPLTLSAALGSLIFGHVVLGVTTSLIIGSVPAVFVGSLLSSRAPDFALRPIIALVLTLSGLKLVGLSTPDLGWALLAGAVVVAVVVGALWLRRERAAIESPGGAPAAPPAPAVVAPSSVHAR